MIDGTVAAEATPDGQSGSFLSGLMGPLRVSERALEALADAIGALPTSAQSSLACEQTGPLAELVPLTKEIKSQVEPMPRTVERISAQAEPLAGLLPALDRLEQGVEQRLEARMRR